MNIFEELMTNQAILNEGVSRKSKTAKKMESKVKIPTNKIKVESMKIFESEDDYDELDDEFATVEAPEDVDNMEDGEVVLVIDPEAPAEEEIPEDAAEAMVGDEVYKCPICGANYVCNCDAEMESLEVDENGVPVECPVCGEDAEQILIGEIAPVEGAGEEDEVPPVDVDDVEEETEEVDETDVDGEDEFKEVDFEEDEVLKDSVVRKPRRPRRRTEAAKRACAGKDCKDPGCKKHKKVREDVEDYTEDEGELDFTDDIIVGDVPAMGEVPTEEKKPVAVYIDIDEVKLESLMNRFLRENYKNKNTRFKVTRGSYRKGILALEYVIRSGRKNVKKGILKFEGYTPAKRTLVLRGRDKGAFTESFSRRPAFIVECVNLRGKLIPTKLRYDFKKKVNESLYRVKGDVGTSRNLKRNTSVGTSRNFSGNRTPMNRKSFVENKKRAR